MAKIDNQKFNELVKAGKYDEAKQLLKEFFAGEWETVDEGEYYVNLMTEYMEMSNVINTAYIQHLQEIKKQLDELDSIKNEADKQHAIGNIKKQIEDL